ncbi:MAG: hypothetical protein NWQ13_08215, partial [Glaciimonas sp.]|nr:hypothetical protein [Glaciimonas sp.]
GGSEDGAAASGQQGLQGKISAGKIITSAISDRPLEISDGDVEILLMTPNNERSMRYSMRCTSHDGRQFQLNGFKRISGTSGRIFPLSLWSETTTLYVTLVEIDTSNDIPTPPIASGIVRIHAPDFIKQLISFRSTGVIGFRSHLRNIFSFLHFFIRRVVPVYFSRK